MQGFTVRASHAITRLAALNLAFLALCVAGLGVLGVAPATAALLRASERERLRPPGDDVHAAPLAELLADMAREWRAEFVRANLAAGPALACAAAMLALGSRGGALAPLALFAALPCLSFAGATLVGIARRTGGTRDALANGATLFALAPGRLLLLDLAWLALLAGTALQHGLAVFGAFALHAALAVRLIRPYRAGTVIRPVTETGPGPTDAGAPA